MAPKYYWIKERHNPQLGIYFIGYGQISSKKAKPMENSLYGMNCMIQFE